MSRKTKPASSKGAGSSGADQAGASDTDAGESFAAKSAAAKSFVSKSAANQSRTGHSGASHGAGTKHSRSNQPRADDLGSHAGASSYRPFEVELRDLAIFLGIVESGSMSVAARRLGLTQSAVSQVIAGMETALGAKLFDREIRPLGLTPSGIALRDRAAGILRDARQAIAAVRDVGRSALPHLHLAMLDTVASAIGPHLVAKLRNMAAHWSVWSGLSSSHREALLARKVDVIITAEADALGGNADLECHDILTEPHLLVLPARYSGPVDCLGDLAPTMDFIRFSARSHTGRQIEQHLRRLRIEPPVRLEFDTSDALLAMVAGGVGWTLATPLCILQGAHHLPQLRCVAMPGPTLFRRITVVARRCELGDVPARIAAASIAVFEDVCLPQIEAFAPGTGERITLGKTLS